MTEMSKDEKEKLIKNNTHLKKYLDDIKNKIDQPVFYSKLPRELREEENPNLIYPTKGVVFIHIFKPQDNEFIEYHAIEPVLNAEEEKKRDKIMEMIYEREAYRKKIKTDKELKTAIKDFLEKVTVLDEKRTGKSKSGKIRVTTNEKRNIEYDITKNIIGGGPLECFLRDPYLEDIHVITGQNVHLIHKIFDMIKTNIHIDESWANTFSQEFSEKIGSPVSEGQPIADGTLPDGSRVNIVYSKDVSLKGPTMTVRKFSETPYSITQLIKWGTLDAGIGAYIWLCLQYGRSLFVCGETASGKTTTTNAVIPFIPPEKRLLSLT